jgi:hypothetical protein
MVRTLHGDLRQAVHLMCAESNLARSPGSGLGKTTLAEIVAAETGGKLVRTTASAINSPYEDHVSIIELRQEHGVSSLLSHHTHQPAGGCQAGDR